jgi:hypothetical protein
MVEILLPEALLRLVDEKARTAGLAREAYIQAVLSKVVGAETTLKDILAPFRQDVAASGITDEELENLFLHARDESYKERTAGKTDEHGSS